MSKLFGRFLLQSLWYDVLCTAEEPTGSVAVYGQGNTSIGKCRPSGQPETLFHYIHFTYILESCLESKNDSYTVNNKEVRGT